MPNNAFDILKVPRSFVIDEQQVRQSYLQQSAACHPDRFTDAMDQADAAEQSARLNQAYQTLLDPEQRANTLIALHGGPAKEDDQSLPPDLLMEVMEAREELEAALEKHDQAAVDKLHDWAVAQRSERLSTITDLFEQTRTQGTEHKHETLKRVRLELNALRYFQRMLDQMP